MKKKTKMVLLGLLILVLLTVAGFGIWYLNRKETPVSLGNKLGVEWYDEAGTEFTIDTVDELYELAELSKYYDFKGQTIKLGADIVVNKGNAADWEKTLPKNLWEPIDGFSGTFDGQGHSISGICGLGYFYGVENTNIVYYPTGLFTNTKKSCVIKDFKLLNSYFSSDLNEGVGSITSNGGGTFDSIYSDAIVVNTKSNTGGLIGVLDASGSHTVTNCWFDGEVRIVGNVGRYGAGIVGRVGNTGGQNKIEHCLNTGSITSSVTGKGVNIGGIVGNIAASGRLNMSDCLSVGAVTNVYGVAVGSILGSVEGNASLNVSDVYVTLDSFSKIIGNISGTANGYPLGYETEMLTGFESYKWTTLNFDEYWAVVEDGTPILQQFAETVPSVASLEKEFDISWYDKTQSEFVITNKKELYGFSMLSYTTNFLGKTVKLGADIVVNEGNAAEWAEDAPEYSWVPIGNVGYPFAGTFDGDMHTVSGLYLSTNTSCSGFISTTSNEAVVKNFKLTHSYFESTTTNLGSIAGRGRGQFDTIYSNAIVISERANVGGIVGQVPADGGVFMNNCWFDGTATNTGNGLGYRRVGGILGYALSDSALTNCLNTGTVDATAYTTQNANNVQVVPLAGGLVGNVAKEKLLTITGCLNAGQIKVSDVATTGYGSIVGYVDGKVAITDTYATSESCARHTVNNNLTGQVATVKASDIKGYSAYQWTLLDFGNNWAVVKSGTPILKAFATEVPSVAGVKKMYDISWYNAEKKSYVIDSKEDLHGFYLLSYNTNFEGKTVKIGKDITINTGSADSWTSSAPSYKWTPIGSASYPFAGTFNGQMRTISGLYLNTDTACGGLFGSVSDTATIKNLKLTNSYFTSTASDLGSIAGIGNGTFDTIYSDAIVVSSLRRVGGLIGQIEKSGKVNNCWFAGTATNTGNHSSNRRVGGIVGLVYSGDVTISNCLNTGVVEATAYTTQNANNIQVVPLAGGIIGNTGSDANVKITDCFNAGEIRVSSEATTGYGAILGYADGVVTISGTHATSESSKKQSGGNKVSGQVFVSTASDISGYNAYQWTLLDFDKYWAAVNASTPVLKSFAGETLSLAGVDRYIDTSWYDENQNEYVLYDLKDLHGFYSLSYSTNFAGKTVKLGTDITVNTGSAADWASNVPTYRWTPVGTYAYPFAGTFDGCMHTISGLYLNTNIAYSGLFAATTKDATVKNLKLKNSYFAATAASFGSIVGCGRGTFETIYSNAIVNSSKGNVGGLIGQIPTDGNATMTNCWFDGSVTSTGNSMADRKTGGLIGYIASDFALASCLNTGSVSAPNYNYDQNANPDKVTVVPLVGGLVGNIVKEKKLAISDSLNVGGITVNAEATTGYGSVVGYADGIVAFTKTYATTESCKKQSGGIVVGRVYTVAEDTITGNGGYQWTMLNFDKYWAIVSTGTPILQSFASKVPSVTVDRMIDISWYVGHENDLTYVLDNKADLYGLALLSEETDFAGKTIKLGHDIVVNKAESVADAAKWAIEVPSYTWNPIGSTTKPFAGTFDGNMHFISGLYLDTTSGGVGLFAATSNSATIKNLELKYSYFKTSDGTIGSIAGEGNGTFDTIYSNAIVVGKKAYVGGLVGVSSYGINMNNCWNTGNVTNQATNASVQHKRTGGLMGDVKATGTITNSLNTGIVDASTYCAHVNGMLGGLVGYVEPAGNLTIEGCLNTGEVKRNTTTDKKTTTGYSSIVGYVDGTANISKTYAADNLTVACRGNYTGSVFQVDAADISGYKGYQWTVLDFDHYWTVVLDNEETEEDESGTPILKSFADETPDITTVTKMLDFDWYDENAKEYVLMDIGDLNGLAVLSEETDFADKIIRLGADIVANEGNATDWAENAPEYKWTPIGSGEKPFAGTFDGMDKDGNIHSISGLYLNTDSQYGGLFAAVATAEGAQTPATVQNLKLLNSYFKTSNFDFGSIAGLGSGEFNTIYSSAIVVTSSGNVGGMIGQVPTDGGITMTNCWFNGSVTNTAASQNKEYRRTGGLVGVVKSDSNITNCLNTATVDASAFSFTKAVCVGGLVGNVGAGKLTVRNCLNLGAVLRKGSAAYGSILGYADSSAEIYASYADADTCNMVAQGQCVVYNAEGTTITQADMAKDTLDTTTLQGFNFDTTWVITEIGMPALTSFKSEMVDTSWYASEPYVLKDRADLYGFAVLSKETDFVNKTIKLGADIVVNLGDSSKWADNAPAYNWIPIGSNDKPFAGTFDGDRHTITGIYLNTSEQYSGLFAATASTAKILNLKLINSYYTTTNYNFGGIAGLGRGEFNTIYSEATVVSASGNVGGLIGQIPDDSGATITNCWNAGNVTNTSASQAREYRRTGGLVGVVKSDSSITNCLNTGTVDASAFSFTKAVCVGGLVGNVGTGKLTVRNCLNIGSVLRKASAAFGSLVGYADSSAEIYASYAGANSCSMVAQGQCVVYNAEGTTITQADMAKDTLDTTTLQGFDFGSVWVIADSGPALQSFVNESVDTSWYE